MNLSALTLKQFNVYVSMRLLTFNGSDTDWNYFLHRMTAYQTARYDFVNVKLHYAFVFTWYNWTDKHTKHLKLSRFFVAIGRHKFIKCFYKCVSTYCTQRERDEKVMFAMPFIKIHACFWTLDYRYIRVYVRESNAGIIETLIYRFSCISPPRISPII